MIKISDFFDKYMELYQDEKSFIWQLWTKDENGNFHPEDIKEFTEKTDDIQNIIKEYGTPLYHVGHGEWVHYDEILRRYKAGNTIENNITKVINDTSRIIKEMERKNMENQNLYLSITLDSDTNNYEIKLHTITCFNKWIAKETAQRIRIYNPENFKSIQMYNIENMTSKIYDLLYKTSNMKSKSILLNTAFTIVIDYFNHGDYRSMWDVTDPCNPEKIEYIEYDSRCCGICEDDEENEEDEECWNDELKKCAQIEEIKDQLNRLYDEIFPNNELTARAQIKMTNKKIDEIIKTIEEKIECIGIHLGRYDQELYPTGEQSLYDQVTDLQDAKNKIQYILDNHEKRIKDVENENMMLKSIILHHFNNDKSPYSGDRK